MSSKSPIFPFPEPHHFSDYGFDPQIDYFQVLEEARRHTKRGDSRPPPLDSLHFKLQKPISKDAAKSKKRHRWWKAAGSALLFWKRAKPDAPGGDARSSRRGYPCGAVSGPLYVTEVSRVAAASCQFNSGPLAAAEVGAEVVPYLSLRGLNLVDGDGDGGAGAKHVPIYLVT